MRKRLMFGSAVVLLVILLTLLVWQVSFNFGRVRGRPTHVETFVFWAVSTLIFVLTVGWLHAVPYRRPAVHSTAKRPAGSRIQTKLVCGRAGPEPAAGSLPGHVQRRILNRTVEKWFSRPARDQERICRT